jgi:uncharacterized protein YidB (DUF937 family)
MGLLDSVIGALSGVRSASGRGDMLSAVLRMLADDGDGPGIDGLHQRFEESGLAETLKSWIGRGANMPIEPDELRRVLGDDTVAAIAQQQGLSQATTADRLAQMLPFVVDKLTPSGRLPEDGFGDFGELMGRMGRR